ncbi:hypothetical protein, partial [Bacillus cereus]
DMVIPLAKEVKKKKPRVVRGFKKNVAPKSKNIRNREWNPDTEQKGDISKRKPELNSGFITELSVQDNSTTGVWL